MANRLLADKHLEDLISLATEAFSRHRLVWRDSDRWRIARVAENGRISSTYATEIVSLWGSRIYVGGDVDDCVFAYADTSNHMRKLRWIGLCDDIGYVHEKAMIGLSDGGRLTTDRIGRAKVPNARVVYAWAAVKRLCALLDEDDGRSGRKTVPGFVGKDGAAWHPWEGDCREVDVEIPPDTHLVFLVDEKHIGRIMDVDALGPQLFVPRIGRTLPLGEALDSGIAKLGKDDGK